MYNAHTSSSKSQQCRRGDSSVRLRLLDRCIWLPFLVVARGFSFFYRAWPAVGTTQLPTQWTPRRFSDQGMNLYITSDFKNWGGYTSTPLYSFMTRPLINNTKLCLTAVTFILLHHIRNIGTQFSYSCTIPCFMHHETKQSRPTT
jgi:hypothetical protein